MSRTTDHAGRPIIAITGAGVVSSLGNGKQENWAKLTGGKSGIHRITRFPTEHLRTTIAGTVDFMTPVEAGSTALTYALAEMRRARGDPESGLSTSEFRRPALPRRTAGRTGMVAAIRARRGWQGERRRRNRL
jgi:3-oxoacyl-[acyl-carrier-protein] synthase II